MHVGAVLGYRMLLDLRHIGWVCWYSVVGVGVRSGPAVREGPISALAENAGNSSVFGDAETGEVCSPRLDRQVGVLLSPHHEAAEEREQALG